MVVRIHNGKVKIIKKNYFDTNKLIPPFLFSANQIKYELLKKQARSSDFKKSIKGKKKNYLLFMVNFPKNILKTH